MGVGVVGGRGIGEETDHVTGLEWWGIIGEEIDHVTELEGGVCSNNAESVHISTN